MRLEHLLVRLNSKSILGSNLIAFVADELQNIVHMMQESIMQDQK